MATEAIDKVAEDQGGMMGGHIAGSWPRDVKQAYNLHLLCSVKKKQRIRKQLTSERSLLHPN